VRRIEAVAGGAVRDWAAQEAVRQDEKFSTLARKKPELAPLPALVDGPDILASLAARAAHLDAADADVREWEKQNAKAAEAGLKARATEVAAGLAGSATDSCVAEVADADGKLLQAIVEALRPQFAGPIFLAGAAGGRVALIAAVPKDLTNRLQAGKLIQEIAPLVGGKGGGRPDLAQGGGTDPTQIPAVLERARALIAG